MCPDSSAVELYRQDVERNVRPIERARPETQTALPLEIRSLQNRRERFVITRSMQFSAVPFGVLDCAESSIHSLFVTQNKLDEKVGRLPS